MTRAPRILVIRRDNIGDLICTTPLLHALRVRYPDAYLAVLVSSYNVAVLAGNPDVDDVFVFIKRQQKQFSLLATVWKRWQLLWRLRRRQFDYVILANGGWRYARQLGGGKMIGFRERDNPDHRQPDVIVPLANRGQDDHEVSKMARLGAELEVPGPLGRTWLFADAARVEDVVRQQNACGWCRERPTIAVHISSRQPVQRWPEQAFVALIQNIVHRFGVQVFLLWAPGKEDDPMHPGDDGKADRVMAGVAGLPVFPCPTSSIPELVAVLSLTAQMICSDGGAMHVAAALDKPILCFFGHSNATEWHPWHVPYVLLQPESRVVADISPDEAMAGFLALQEKLGRSGMADLNESLGLRSDGCLTELLVGK